MSSLPDPPFRYWCEVGVLMELYGRSFEEALAELAEMRGKSVAEVRILYEAGNPALRHNIDGRGQNRNPLAAPPQPRRR